MHNNYIFFSTVDYGITILCIHVSVLIACRPAYFQALLQAGADMDAKNEEEQTPLHLAAKAGKTK